MLSIYCYSLVIEKLAWFEVGYLSIQLGNILWHWIDSTSYRLREKNEVSWKENDAIEYWKMVEKEKNQSGFIEFCKMKKEEEMKKEIKSFFL